MSSVSVGTYSLVLVIFLAVLAVATSTIRIAKEYERGVVFRLGRLIPLKGPGPLLHLSLRDRSRERWSTCA